MPINLSNTRRPDRRGKKNAYTSVKGDRNAAIIAAIREADTFLTPKQIRDSVGVTGPANTGQYASVMAALPYMRKHGLLIGVELYRRNVRTGHFLKLYVYGLPSFYQQGDKQNGYNVHHERKLIDLIIKGDYYFRECGEFSRPKDYVPA